jgi:hypothetical protein
MLTFCGVFWSRLWLFCLHGLVPVYHFVRGL